MQITELKSKIDVAMAKIETLSSNVSSLRGLVNRKIGNEEKAETQDLNNGMLIPFNGSFK